MHVNILPSNRVKQVKVIELISADTANELFGNIVFDFRKTKKFNTTIVANLVNIGRHTLRKHEKGQIECSIKKADKLCQAFGFTMSIIFTPIDCKGFEYKCSWQDIPKTLCQLRTLTGKNRTDIAKQLECIKNNYKQNVSTNKNTLISRLQQYESGVTIVTIKFLVEIAKLYKYSVSLELTEK